MKRHKFNELTSNHHHKPERRGAIILLTAFLLIVMLALCAFAIDLGFVVNARTEAQRAVDAGAYAGAALLPQGTDASEAEALALVGQNYVSGADAGAHTTTVEFGHWDESTRTFSISADKPSAIRVVSNFDDRPMFFGQLFGQNMFGTAAEAIATYQPRDIMVVLDYSGSMNDDSEFRQISSLGRAAIEKNLLEIYEDLGSPRFGNMQWTPTYLSSDNTSTIKRQLGLSNTPYPYPGGSWNDYIRYVRTSGNVNRAGYRKRYGYMTLVNYWLERQPRYNQTPDLWQTRQQPITAVKDSLQVFLAYLQEAETNDRVGLAVYTAADGTATLESPLTADYQSIEDTSRQRQAGHYDVYTNIGAGIKEAREELERNGRPSSKRMILLMTDGIANRPSDTTTARAYVRSQAQLAADSRLPIVTVSLGAGADTALMQEVADMTSGVHFNIPGGQTVAEYEEDLKDVFRAVAADRPLKLVK